MVTLAGMKNRERLARECERARVRECVRQSLAECLPPGSQVWAYGSLVRPGRFHDESDIDLALEDEGGRVDLARLTNEVSRRTGRSVDLCRLSETRLASRIRREGEQWTL